MRRRALLFALLTLPLLPHASAQPQTGVVEGRVVDADGNPVSAVDHFQLFSGEVVEVALASDGSFRQEMRAGELWGALAPSLAGESPWGDLAIGCRGATGCLLVEAGATTRLDLTLPRAGVVEGRVWDASGAPVAGATVASTTLGGIKKVSTRTDAEGAYRLALGPGPRDFGVGPPEGLLAGEWYLPCRVGSSRGCLNLTAGGVVTKDVTLPGRVEIQGVVRDPSGAPVSGAYVEAHGGAPDPRDIDAGMTLVTRTDEEGRFLLVTPLPLSGLSVDLEGVSPVSDPQMVGTRRTCGKGECPALAPGGTAWLNVTLPRGGTVRGRILDDSGAVPEGSRLAFGSHGALESLGPDGRFERLLAPGRHPLKLTYAQGAFALLPCRAESDCVEVRPGEATWVNLTLPRMGTLRLDVQASPKTLPVHVRAWNAMGLASDPGGILRLPPGRYAIGASGLEEGLASVRGTCPDACVEVRAGEETRHTIRVEGPIPVQGRLGLPEDVDDVEAAGVLVEGPLGTSAVETRWEFGFGLRATPGRYALATHRLDGDSGWATWSAPFTVDEGGRTTLAPTLRNVTVLARGSLGPFPGWLGDWHDVAATLVSDGARTALFLEGHLLPPDLEVLVDGQPPRGRLVRALDVGVLPSAGLAAGQHEWRVRADGLETVLVATTLEEPDDAPAPPTQEETAAPPAEEGARPTPEEGDAPASIPWGPALAVVALFAAGFLRRRRA